MHHLRLSLPLAALLGSGAFDQSLDSLPATNQKVLAFADAHMGQRVGTGECWDLAAEALNYADATWNGRDQFGRVLDLEAEPVLPGDIIQFEGVETRMRTATKETRERMGHHTAIVHALIGPGRYMLAHQNFGPQGRKVGLTEFNSHNVVSGTCTYFRPVGQ